MNVELLVLLTMLLITLHNQYEECPNHLHQRHEQEQKEPQKQEHTDRWQRVAKPKAMALPMEVLMELKSLALSHRKDTVQTLSFFPMCS